MAKNHSPASEMGEGAAPEGSARELIVVTKAAAGIQVAGDVVASTTGTDISVLKKILTEAGARLSPLFGMSEDRLRADAATVTRITGQPVPDLSVYYRVEGSNDRLENLADSLRRLDVVAAAYIKPAAEPPFLNNMQPSPMAPPSTTPDFSGRQGYLDPAPGGIDARYAWTVPGGEGDGVSVIDVEGAWRFTHEDLLQNQGGTIGTPSSDLNWRNHGTAVVGVLGGDVNGFGVTGISPSARTSGCSIFGGVGSAAAILQAANRLNPGDIVLIELHRPGPRFGFQPRPDQRGYIALEWWPDDLDAIRYAAARGVIVVGAAGNGAENLDDPLYETPGTGFPTTWRNPFNPRNPGSGAVLVGAGAPPPGTHGANHGPDRSRLDFSNYGAVLTAQGWGREVTTCGYGDLQGGANEDLWYTDRFSGTSSSSPVVVGALACVQGVLTTAGNPRLTPATARAILLETGSPQQDALGRPSSQRIGNRPNIKQMIERLPYIAVEQPPVPMSAEILANGTRQADLTAGLGYLGMAPVKRVTLTGNNADPVTVNDQLTVPAGTRRAVLTFNMVTMGFGHGQIIEGPFARFAFQVSANTLSGSLLTFRVWSYFRNRNHNAWEAMIDVSAMCFG